VVQRGAPLTPERMEIDGHRERREGRGRRERRGEEKGGMIGWERGGGADMGEGRGGGDRIGPECV